MADEKKDELELEKAETLEEDLTTSVPSFLASAEGGRSTEVSGEEEPTDAEDKATASDVSTNDGTVESDAAAESEITAVDEADVPSDGGVVESDEADEHPDGDEEASTPVEPDSQNDLVTSEDDAKIENELDKIGETSAGEPAEATAAPEVEKTPESDSKGSSGDEPKKVGFFAQRIGMPVGLALAAGGIVVGLLVGSAVFGSGASTTFAGKSSITEAELDAPIAVVNYKGKKIDISARDIITTSSTLTSAKKEDGTYDLPSAEFVLTAARDKVLENEAEARGVRVSEEDLKTKSMETLGTDDISAIATTYGMDEETIRTALKSQCIQDKMREQSGSDMETPEPPTAPDSPAKGSEDTATADYAKYIIGLAGNAWDEKAGKWADPESIWATSLTEEAGFTSSKATYEAASMAYSVAYTDFVEKQTAYSDVWQKLSDDIYSNASVSISTLIQ